MFAEPTAVQPVVQDTPFSTLEAPPVAFGVVWTVQALPSQPSARVDEPRLAAERPTAVHAAAAMHDTPVSELPCVAPVGTGVFSSVQLVPFQRSARGC